MDLTTFSAIIPKIVEAVLPHFSDVKEKLEGIENRLTKLEASHEVVRDFLQGGPLTTVNIDAEVIAKAISRNLAAECITLNTVSPTR